MLTFREYLSDADSQQGLDPDFVRRFIESGDDVGSLNELIAFTKARWPDHFSRDWRKSMAHMPNGRDKMATLWARYLAHRESEAA